MSWARRRQADMKADANARGTMTLGDWLAAAATFVALALIGYGTVRRDWPTVRRAVAWALWPVPAVVLLHTFGDIGPVRYFVLASAVLWPLYGLLLVGGGGRRPPDEDDG